MLRFVWYSPSDWRRRHKPPTSAAETLHRLYAEHIWLSPFLYMRASAALSLILWPLIVLVLSLRWTARHGTGVRARTGKTIRRQMREQFQVASRTSVLPLRYYQNELFDDALRARADEYLLFHEFKTVHYGLLKMRLPAERRESLKPKDRFAAACSAFGLPTVPVFMVLRQGRIESGAGTPAQLPRQDLFVKKLSGKGGRDVERWRYDAEHELWRDGAGIAAAHDQLLAHLLQRSQRQGLIIQPVLRLHPAIADLSPDGFATVRVVSQIDEDRDIEITMAMARLPRSPGILVDNVARGGFGSAVDLQTGRLGPAADYRHAATWHDRHPATGGTITGRLLPDWPAGCALVRKAHRSLLPERACVSWDLALTDQGPLLIEANFGGDLDFFQRAIRRPLGNERLGILFARHVARAAAGEAPLLARADASLIRPG